MKAKKVKSNKANLPLASDTKSLITVPVKAPGIPKGYEVAKIEVVFRKVNAVNPAPQDLIKKEITAKKTVAKPTAKKTTAKKVVAKKMEADKKVVKKK
ncbi:MAG: hypothetical protein WCL06_15255 [Bacteroidota bacterium]